MLAPLLTVAWLLHCSTVANFGELGEDFMASNEGADYRNGLRLSEQSHQIVDGGILTQELWYEEFSTDIDESVDFPLGRVYGRRTRYNVTDAGELRVLRAEPHGPYTHVGTYTRFRDFGDESFGVYCRAFPSRN